MSEPGAVGPLRNARQMIGGERGKEGVRSSVHPGGRRWGPSPGIIEPRERVKTPDALGRTPNSVSGLPGPPNRRAGGRSLSTG